MKAFYSNTAESVNAPAAAASWIDSDIPSRARVAVYEAPGAAPRVVDVSPGPVAEYIEQLASTVHRLASELGGTVPYSVIREVTENFIHADFAEPVVSILDSGRTIRFADSGPGIADKARAILPGFTSATAIMKHYIRGVGSGLPLVRDFLGLSGGALHIEDNVGRGAVVTVSAASPGNFGASPAVRPTPATPPTHPGPQPTPSSPALSLLDGAASESTAPVLTTRQKQVLAIVMESGTAGPSIVSKELGVGISTAYRDLASLEERGLIAASDGGKRTLTEAGLSYLDGLTSGC